MGRITVPYLREKRYTSGKRKGELIGYYWEPTADVVKHGKDLAARPLGKDRRKATAQAEAFNETYQLRRRGAEIVDGMIYPAGSFGAFVGLLRRSVDYLDRAKRTNEQYEHNIRPAVRAFGSDPIEGITLEDCELYYQALRGKDAQGKLLPPTHKAADHMKWLRWTFEMAIKRERLERNPATGVKVSRPKPRRNVWTPFQVYLLAAALWRRKMRPHAVAVMILYDTGLRPQDVCALTRGAYLGDLLDVTTLKTDYEAALPITDETQYMIDRYLQDGTQRLPEAPLLRGPKGAHYRREYLSREIRAVMREIEMPDELQLRDLRRTANQERAEGGATAAEMAAANQQTIAHSARILDTYTVRNTALAKAAQKKRQKNIG